MSSGRREYILLDEGRHQTQQDSRKSGRLLPVIAFSFGLLCLAALLVNSGDWSSSIETVGVSRVSQDNAGAMQQHSFAKEQDTFIDLDSELDSAEPEHARYLSYLPHSGLHNQMICLQNALILGHMLNRTVIIPYIRLGRAIGFGDWEGLQNNLALNEKATKVKKCRPLYEAGERMEGACTR